MSSPTHKTTTQLQCLQQGGPLKLVQVSFPQPPTGDQVLIHQKVVALNLVDTKHRDYNITNSTYPCVLGLEGGGVVEAVGEDVKALKVGDEVAGWEWEAFRRESLRRRACCRQRSAATTGCVSIAPNPGHSLVETSRPCPKSWG